MLAHDWARRSHYELSCMHVYMCMECSNRRELGCERSRVEKMAGHGQVNTAQHRRREMFRFGGGGHHSHSINTDP